MPLFPQRFHTFLHAPQGDVLRGRGGIAVGQAALEVKNMATSKDIDRLLESFVERGLPGCSLKVMQRGTTLYEGYFGRILSRLCLSGMEQRQLLPLSGAVAESNEGGAKNLRTLTPNLP